MFYFVPFTSSFPQQTRLLHTPAQQPPKASETSASWDLRGQLGVVDQVLQRVTATELVQQTRQVADDGGGVRGVDVAGNVANLNQGQVPVGVGSLSRGDLRRTTPVCVTSPGTIEGLFHRNTGVLMHLTENRLCIWEETLWERLQQRFTLNLELSLFFNSRTPLSVTGVVWQRRNSAVNTTQHQNIDTAREKAGKRQEIRQALSRF